MSDYTELFGWNEEAQLKYRLQMYREFNKNNPQVKRIGCLLAVITILQVLYYLGSLIYYFEQIDKILIELFSIKTGNDGVKFSNELERYIKCLKKPDC